MRWIVIGLALATLVAGCVSPATEDAADAASLDAALSFIDPIVDDHDHGSLADHNLSMPSMRLVGHTTMNAEAPAEAFSYIGEMDTHGNLTVVQVLGRGSMPGFVVLDVSDPANPTPIGRAQMPFSYVVDVKFSPDGAYVFAGSQGGAAGSNGHAAPTDDPVNAFLTSEGFTQFDMSDPTNPVAIAGGWVSGGCHMLSVKEIAGTLSVFCIADTVQVFQYLEGGAWTQVAALAPETAGASQLLGEVASGSPNSAANALLLGATPHDVTVQPDPLDESRWIAAVSYWDFGVMFYDVTDLESPVALGAWTGEGAANYEGNVHGAMLTLHEGKRVAVVGPELLGQTVPALWVLDVEDFAAPSLVAEWVPPGAHPTQGLLLTVHQFQVVGGRIYLAYNHAGLWVLDLATIARGPAAPDAAAHPEVLGYYLPHENVTLYSPDTAAVPNTWDVNVKDGYIFASDRYTGFYVLHYAGDVEGDAATTSFA